MEGWDTDLLTAAENASALSSGRVDPLHREGPPGGGIRGRDAEYGGVWTKNAGAGLAAEVIRIVAE
ncbi:MAG TPA: hypothetical protein VF730_04365 [Terracidiphilus sp.]